jgi:SAM-dependent methyltransferase
MEKYLKGKDLFGNDYNLEQIKEWYEREKEGYADLGSKDKINYNYVYHEQNKRFGFDHLKGLSKDTVLSIGGAYGYELLPIVKEIKDLHILEPSDNLRQDNLEGVKINYHTPEISGDMPFEDNMFDLITCIGVLHHIPNVGHILKEGARVLNRGGRFLIREPIVSMGDWRQERLGLTKNERGIPLDVFQKLIKDAGLKVEKRQLCFSKPFDILFTKLTGKAAYNSPVYVKVDKFLAKIFRFNYTYHADSFFKKIRPAGVFYVLSKK